MAKFAGFFPSILFTLLLARLTLPHPTNSEFVQHWSSEPAAPSGPKLLGTFRFPSAAFTSLYPRGQGKHLTFDLILSSFGIFSTDVAIVRNVHQHLKHVSSIKPESLTKHMKWPNSVQGVPPEVFQDGRRVAVIPDGFLVPGKGEGSVSLIDLNKPYTLRTISSGEGDWFYHRVLWRDMDKDGKLDALTCRASKPVIGSFKSGLIWFRHPGTKYVESPWDLNFLVSGPDVNFIMTNMTAGSRGPREVIVTTEFFNPRLRIFWTEDEKQDWSNTAQIKSRNIDTKLEGSPFDVIYFDINNDKQPELIVTYNDHKNGSVVAYEVPKDFRTGEFKKHVLASGYFAEVRGEGTGAPGSPFVLYRKTQEKPSLLISGDDSARASLLTPTGTSDWSYERSDFLLTKNSTVGGMSLADVDNDGTTELFVPSYHDGLVYVYQFQ